jgi:hypothetical protein
MGVTSINGIVLPAITTATFTATASPQTFQGVAHLQEFLTFDNSGIKPDFSNLDGIIDVATGQKSGTVSNAAIAFPLTCSTTSLSTTATRPHLS